MTTHDQARAIAAVLDVIGAPSVTFVGSSYGGMVALAFAELFASRVSGLVLLCAAHRTHPMATALRSIQRSVVRLGEEGGAPAEGLALARALAMTTYRSVDEFERRFDYSPDFASLDIKGGEVRFPVQDYLEARGEAFASVFDVESYVSLSTSIDIHYVDPELVKSRTTLLSFDTDALVPPWLVEELAPRGSGRLRARNPCLAFRPRCVPQGARTRLVRTARGHREPWGGPMITASRTTRTVRSGIADDTSHGAVIPPIHLSVKFRFRQARRMRSIRLHALATDLVTDLRVALMRAEEVAYAVA